MCDFFLKAHAGVTGGAGLASSAGSRTRPRQLGAGALLLLRRDGRDRQTDRLQ